MGVVTIAAIACLVVGAFHFLFRRLLSLERTVLSPQDIAENPFSPGHYRIMDRLLDQSDDDFLAAHPNCNRRMRRRFRRGRVAIFRGYLKMLSEDFNRICRAIKLHAINSEVDRSDLAALMMKEQFQFFRNMYYVEFRLAIYATGWKGVDASGLIASLNVMRDSLQDLAAAVEPSAA
jgi:hypothetical protein